MVEPAFSSILGGMWLTSRITAEVADNATMAVTPDAPETRRIYVKVGKRDTLASIAARYRVSVSQVKEWNGLHHDGVSRGQSLQLQVPNRMVASSGGKKASHNVRYHTASASHSSKSKVAAKKGGKPVVLASARGSRS